jgi:hypothetical protein
MAIRKKKYTKYKMQYGFPRSGSDAFFWHLTPWPPLLKGEGEKGVGGKGGEVHENNEK